MNKPKTFEQLLAWQKAQDLAVEIYKLTRIFPAEEKFALIDQLRRAVSSVSANIAEGFGRHTVKNKVQFYSIAYGSLLETKNYLYLAQKLSYISLDSLDSLLLLVVDCQKLINGLIKSIKANA